MDFTQTVLARRSTRSYSGEHIPMEKLEKVLEAALLAPTSRGKKTLEFLLVQDKALLTKLAEAKQSGSQMLADADACVVVCADENVSDVWVEDSSVAMSFMMLQATDLGIGNCWVQCRNRFTADGKASGDYIREIFGLGANYQVGAILALGMPSGKLAEHSASLVDKSKVHRF